MRMKLYLAPLTYLSPPRALKLCVSSKKENAKEDPLSWLIEQRLSFRIRSLSLLREGSLALRQCGLECRCQNDRAFSAGYAVKKRVSAEQSFGRSFHFGGGPSGAKFFAKFAAKFFTKFSAVFCWDIQSQKNFSKNFSPKFPWPWTAELEKFQGKLHDELLQGDPHQQMFLMRWNGRRNSFLGFAHQALWVTVCFSKLAISQCVSAATLILSS